MAEPPPGRRIAIVGTTGSGKTTLASRLAAVLACHHIELDALYWGPGWEQAPGEVFRARVAEALKADSWVADGNYSRSRDIVWGAADTVVWLDYSLPVILGRLSVRTVRRGLSGDELWNGNRENLWRQFFTRDSILLWALKTYRRRRREIPAALAGSEFGHLATVRLRSPRETETWLAAIEAQRGSKEGDHSDV